MASKLPPIAERLPATGNSVGPARSDDALADRGKSATVIPLHRAVDLAQLARDYDGVDLYDTLREHNRAIRNRKLNRVVRAFALAVAVGCITYFGLRTLWALFS